MSSGQISVVIITFNEEGNIARCIDSVKAIADEIIVLDSFSTDDTVHIAKQRGAIVTQHIFEGHIEQKNRALEIATHSYVLSLDADEALDETLLNAILQEKKALHHKAYSMNRCAHYCGKFIYHGLWYPDKKLRLFDKRIATWGGMNPHDKIVLNEQTPVKHLPGDILHYTYNTVEEHILQSNKFSTISAEVLYRKGKKGSLLKILISPLWAFINGYILRMGFLDGRYGFIIAINYAHQTFQKYVKLALLREEK